MGERDFSIKEAGLVQQLDGGASPAAGEGQAPAPHLAQYVWRLWKMCLAPAVPMAPCSLWDPLLALTSGRTLPRSWPQIPFHSWMCGFSSLPRIRILTAAGTKFTDLSCLPQVGEAAVLWQELIPKLFLHLVGHEAGRWAVPASGQARRATHAAHLATRTCGGGGVPCGTEARVPLFLKPRFTRVTVRTLSAGAESGWRMGGGGRACIREAQGGG